MREVILMRNTIFFGNGLNRISKNSVSWDALLKDLQKEKKFNISNLPYTMVYERTFMESSDRETSRNEFEIKQRIANAMEKQGPNHLLELIAKMPFENYITTNYDYSFEKALGVEPARLSTESVYSLRRKREYLDASGKKVLWNIHGEIEHPKSIMLGLDHYCGSVSKLDAYIKGRYTYENQGKPFPVDSMLKKLKNNDFCFSSWVDLFFSTNVHILGFSLDYSEIDIWWLLNKRARFLEQNQIENEIYFYVHEIDDEKKGLLKSFDVQIVQMQLCNNDFAGMYEQAIQKMI